jgi:DNA replication protein DnaC
MKWIKENKNFLILTGCPGSGKTYAAYAMLQDEGLMKGRRYKRFWTESSFMGKIKSSFDTSGSAEDLIASLCDDDLFVYDDLASSMMTDWKKEVIFNMINTRYNLQKPTIITTNLTEHACNEVLGGRIASRLFAKENVVIDFGDLDIRKE